MAQPFDVDFAGADGHGARSARAWGDVPWQIWIVVALLSLEGIGNFFSMFDNLAAAYWLTGKILIITGLLKGWQWMFWIFLAVAALHVVGFLSVMPVASLLNLLLMALTFSARRYFFTGGAVSTSSAR